MVTVSELIEFMSFILKKNEDGLAILVGAAPAPTALELYEMRCGGQVDYGVRIDGGEGVPHAQSALESVEGIEEIISDAPFRARAAGSRATRERFPPAPLPRWQL